MPYDYTDTYATWTEAAYERQINYKKTTKKFMGECFFEMPKKTSPSEETFRLDLCFIVFRSSKILKIKILVQNPLVDWNHSGSNYTLMLPDGKSIVGKVLSAGYPALMIETVPTISGGSRPKLSLYLRGSATIHNNLCIVRELPMRRNVPAESVIDLIKAATCHYNGRVRTNTHFELKLLI